MTVNKPARGDQNWDATLNAALDYLDGKLLAVPSNIVPTTSNTYTLGTSTQRWADVYIGPNTLHITDTVTAADTALTVTNGVLQINGANQLQVGQLKFIDNTIESTTGSTDIQIGLTSSSANLVLNRNVHLAANKSLTFSDSTVQTTAAIAPAYGSYESTVSQSSGGTTSANLVTFNTTTSSSSTSLVSSSQITYATAGTYALDFNGMFSFTGGASNYNITVWYAKNGTAVTNSAYTFTTTSAQASQVMGHITDIITVAANDYIQFYWWAGASGIALTATAAGTNPTRPASSSATLNTWRVA